MQTYALDISSVNAVQSCLILVFSACKILHQFKVQDSESEYCVFDMQMGKQLMAGSDWYLDSTASAFSLSHGTKPDNFLKMAKISSDRPDRQGMRQGYLNWELWWTMSNYDIWNHGLRVLLTQLEAVTVDLNCRGQITAYGCIWFMVTPPSLGIPYNYTR